LFDSTSIGVPRRLVRGTASGETWFRDFENGREEKFCYFPSNSGKSREGRPAKWREKGNRALASVSLVIFDIGTRLRASATPTLLLPCAYFSHLRIGFEDIIPNQSGIHAGQKGRMYIEPRRKLSPPSRYTMR